eukprot:418697-Amphidinium_carterae.3
MAWDPQQAREAHFQKQKQVVPLKDQRASSYMAEAKSLAEKVDKVIEETLERRDALKEDLVTVFCKIENLPQERCPSPRRPRHSGSESSRRPTQNPGDRSIGFGRCVRVEIDGLRFFPLR